MNSQQQSIPYIEILDEEDKAEYLGLQKKFLAPTSRSRQKTSTSFNIFLDQIKEFVSKNTESKWKRSFVCGVCWTDLYLIVNSRQLQILIGKSKSTVNQILKDNFDKANLTLEETILLIEQSIPILSGLPNERKQWRVLVQQQPVQKDKCCRKSSESKGTLQENGTFTPMFSFYDDNDIVSQMLNMEEETQFEEFSGIPD